MDKLRVFNIEDLRDMKLDKPKKVYITSDGIYFARHYIERPEIDRLYDRTTKKVHRVKVLHEGEWYDIDDAAEMGDEIKDTDPIGHGFLYYVEK